MTVNDAERAMRLDQQLDVLLGRSEDGGRESLEADTVATLRYLHAIADRPVPDAVFIDRLRHALVGPESVLSHRVILRHEGSRRTTNALSHEPRLAPPRAPLHGGGSLAGAQNDTNVAHESLSLPSLNGQSQLLSDVRFSPPWWQRWELGAAILVIAVLGSYFGLALPNLGRTISPPSRLGAITAQTEGTAPVELRIGAIGIDAPIERRLSVAENLSPEENLWATGWLNGAPVPMAEPGEPFAAAWLDESAAPGEGGNIVLHGHLDYWDTSPALFGDLDELIAGDRIDITGANDTVYSYEVEWSRRFPSHVDEDQQRDILGPTAEESLTLITGAGEYDREMGYPEALVVRAYLVGH